MSTSQPIVYKKHEDYVCRILAYNVEWGFLKLPGDVNKDSCGHSIPQTPEAQENHLKLVSKNIGVINPDVCFLEEMGSLEAVQTIASNIDSMFGETYSVYYSNTDSGYQGVGLLIKSDIVGYTSVENIPNFPLNRALGVTINRDNKEYKMVGVHLKSLYDHNYKKDIPEQLAQLAAVNLWVGSCENSIVCGDMNNTPDSEPIKKMTEYGYTDIIESDKYVPNITNNKYTEFHGKDGDESGSRIDYMFTKGQIEPLSVHIVDLVRENPNAPDGERKETSDHLPILGIFKL